ncbi:MAG: class II aldolase/adducin family protein [Planctomycetota bacterium]
MGLLEKYKAEVGTFIGVCHKVAARRFTTSHGGNLAWKVADDVIIITATRLAKGEHTPADVVFIDGKGTVLEGTRKPTGEVPMYLTFFRERPDVRSVIHCHPVCCGAYAVTQAENALMRPVYPEVILEIGPVPVVPYATPLTQALADNFKPFLPKYNAFLMENHGLAMLTPGDIDWAFHLVDELESAADSLLRAQALGLIKEMGRPEIEEMDQIVTIRKLARCGAPGVNKSLADLYCGK